MLFKPSLMTAIRKQASPPLSVQQLSVDLEIVTFLILIRDNESIYFKSFWKNYTRALPWLSQVAVQNNEIPVTSVWLEQVFSVADAIKNIQQASMSSVTLRSLMILEKKKNIEKFRSFPHP